MAEEIMTKALARRTDPAQCHDAADRAAKFAPTHRARILAALKEHGPRTAHELAALIRLTPEQIDRRMIELRRACEARAHCVCIDAQRIEVKRGTPSGGMAQVWEACEPSPSATKAKV